MNKAALWIAAIVLLTVIAVGGFLFYQRLTASIDVLVEQGPGTPAANSSSPLSAVDEAALEERLLAVGLNPQPVLGDTGVNGHLQRQETGEVSEETLNQYADDLALLNQMSSQEGSRIPTDFWDVRTKAMTELDWDEYSVVQHLASPEMAPYVRLLAQGYDRFLQFKDGEEVGEETALDAALDMFALVETYYESVPASNLTEHAPGIEGEAEEVLLIWQSLVAGSTRINPLTGNPMFNHSIYARDNVGTIYQYDQDQAMSISDVWGVTGFAPHFVGMPTKQQPGRAHVHQHGAAIAAGRASAGPGCHRRGKSGTRQSRQRRGAGRYGTQQRYSPKVCAALSPIAARGS